MELDVPREFRRNYPASAERARESATYTLAYVLDRYGWDDFSEVEMLDVGCGTKLTEALLDRPIRRYAGVDVNQAMIRWLRENIGDVRFEHHHVDFHNARYNPEGERLKEEGSHLPVDGRFDLIVLLSVFTHLEPHDYRPMLRTLRRYAKPNGRLFYTIFLDERSETGHGVIDAYTERFGEAAVGTTDGYQDYLTDDPLAVALYTREYALRLVEGTGWRVEGVGPPNEFMQHQITCRPE